MFSSSFHQSYESFNFILEKGPRILENSFRKDDLLLVEFQLEALYFNFLFKWPLGS